MVNINSLFTILIMEAGESFLIFAKYFNLCFMLCFAKIFGHRAFYVINFNWENAKNAREFCAAKLLTFTLNSLPRSIFELRSTPFLYLTKQKKHPTRGAFSVCEETHKRCVSVGKNAKKVRKSIIG